MRHLTLPPFGAADVRRLTESMAGPLPEEIHEVVGRLSAGSPFMAAAVLQGLVESGALVAGPAGWHAEALALADVQSSRHAAAFLVRRLELLPPEVLKLLRAGAVLGKEFDLNLAAALANQTAIRAVAALDEARRASSSGLGPTTPPAPSFTTSCVRPCWSGSRPSSARNCTGRPHCFLKE